MNKILAATGVAVCLATSAPAYADDAEVMEQLCFDMAKLVADTATFHQQGIAIEMVLVQLNALPANAVEVKDIYRSMILWVYGTPRYEEAEDQQRAIATLRDAFHVKCLELPTAQKGAAS